MNKIQPPAKKANSKWGPGGVRYSREEEQLVAKKYREADGFRQGARIKRAAPQRQVRRAA